MHLCEVHCRNFRCLADTTFVPCDGLNIVYGGNAQGKTTLLESILFVATSKSHRTTTESELTAYDSDEFHVRAQVRRGGRDILLEANWWKGAKRFKVNGVSQARISDILGRLNVVFFSPEDVALVRGGASVRRHFMDMELSQISPVYLQALQQYRQALRQRNELLRANNLDPAIFEPWEEQLGQHGALLIRERTRFIEELSVLTRKAYERIAGDEPLSLVFRPNVRRPEDLRAVLESTRAQDVRRHRTNHGPHRDDLEVVIEGRPARSHASQGQQRTAALALKLAELDLVYARTGEHPVLMLDEVLAELDKQRAERLFDAVNPNVQSIVTTTDDTLRNAGGRDAHARFRIERGRLERE